MSPIPALTPDSFPAWARLNGVDLHRVELRRAGDKGLGLFVSETGEGDPGSNTSPPVLRIPRDLILTAEAVEDYAKVDLNFRRLLDAVGHQSSRIRIMLYLLCHLVHSRKGHGQPRGCSSTAWTEYVGLLPRTMPVPTMWSEDERLLLKGTSLEVALEAKWSALAREFDHVRHRSQSLEFWNAFLWEQPQQQQQHVAASVEDWILVDAWHRSRRLELPDGEEAMVACLELVNHSSRPSAYYEVEPDGDLALFMRPGCRGSQGQELTISYGEAKSAAEMLFSYGFIDGEGATRELRLHLDPLPDDPLAKAKIAVLKARPTLRLSLKSGDLGEGREVRWECPSIELLCLNEEDGLSFQLAQDEAGERHLRLFWRGEDVTETEGELGALVQGCDLAEVLRLRAISLLQDRVEWQLARLKGSPSSPERPPTLEASQGRWEACLELASALKRVEREILERTAEVLEKEKSNLLEHDRVVAYLGSMEDAQNDQGPRLWPSNEEDDFS